MTSTLICVKSRVAPAADKSKKLTIVLLKLLGALITARLTEFGSKTLNILNNICFSDSMITIGRIRRGHQNYKIWVARRLQEIETLVPKENRKLIPGILNPSDAASRGLNAKKLLKNK